jgi:hypothetical protein
MVSRNDGRVSSEPERPIKRAYHKPSVQIYGTLSQITQAQPNPAAFALDPTANAPHQVDRRT